MPVDAARHARDVWRACTQVRGTVRAYVDAFRWALLHVIGAMYNGRYMRGSTGHEEAMDVQDTCAVHV